MKKIEFSARELETLAQYLKVPKAQEKKLRSAFLRSPYQLLKRARVELPPNIKSEDWLFLILKRILQIPLSEEEQAWLHLIDFFQINDFAAVNQGLSVLEGMCSLEGIAEFFDINLEKLFYNEEPLFISGYGDSTLYQSMSWLQSDPKLAGYVWLWFLAFIYTEDPQKLHIEQGEFRFFPVYKGEPDRKSRENIHFSVIPPAFYQLSSIQKLLLPKELQNIPPKLLCLPNLRELELNEGVEQFICSDVGALRDSPISLVRLQNQAEQAARIPNFIWYLPQMKRLILENMGFISVPSISQVEQLEIYSALKKSSLNFNPAINLRKITIFLKYRKLDWHWDLPLIEEILLLSVGHFILEKEAECLRKISLKGADVISLEQLPELEEFHIGFFHKAYQPNTDAILLSLQKAPKLRELRFASSAVSWPKEAGVWQKLEFLDISEWQNLEAIKAKLEAPNLYRLCCNIQQLQLTGLPRNVKQLHLRQPFHISAAIPENIEILLQKFSVLEELTIEHGNFPSTVASFQDSLRLKKLVINGQRII